MTRADIETMRSLQVQAMTGSSDSKINARVRLIQFITEKNPVAFRDVLDAATEKLQRNARAA